MTASSKSNLLAFGGAVDHLISATMLWVEVVDPQGWFGGG
jgi:hypothetical protein